MENECLPKETKGPKEPKHIQLMNSISRIDIIIDNLSSLCQHVQGCPNLVSNDSKNKKRIPFSK